MFLARLKVPAPRCAIFPPILNFTCTITSPWFWYVQVSPMIGTGLRSYNPADGITLLQ